MFQLDYEQCLSSFLGKVKQAKHAIVLENYLLQHRLLARVNFCAHSHVACFTISKKNKGQLVVCFSTLYKLA